MPDENLSVAPNSTSVLSDSPLETKSFEQSVRDVLNKIESKLEVGEFNRDENDESEWSKIKERILHLFKIGEHNNDSLDQKINSNFSRIERGFIFSDEAEDGDFNFLHVEQLLDQAADLLDRGIRDRFEWDEISEKMLNLSLELNEYKDLDKIHRDEEESGIYDVERKQSLADLKAEKTIEQTQNTLAGRVEAELVYGSSSIVEINKALKAEQFGAWLQGVVPYYWKGQRFGGYIEYNIDGVVHTVADHLLRSTGIQGLNQYSRLRETVRMQMLAYLFQKLVSKERLEGYSAKQVWEEANAKFKRRRTKVARKYQDLKAKASTDEDGILNYSKRLNPLKKRFQNDFRDALARLKNAQKGLKLIYDYGEPLPIGESRIEYFDDCLIWTRKAIQWLVRFSGKDQGTIYPVSVRNTIGKENWKNSMDLRLFEFDLSNEFLNRLKNVRLRGISAFYSTDKEKFNRIIQLEVKAPSEAVVRVTDSSNGLIDQSHLPPVILGRVASRNFTREPDLIGVTSLHNASPIGKWEIRVLGPQQLELDKIEDLQIDLHLAYRV